MTVLEPYRGQWTKTHAAHLLNRAGFGGLPADIERAAKLGLDRSVDALVDFDRVEETIAPPALPDNPANLREVRKLSEEEKKKLFRANREAIEEIRGWWIGQMLRTQRPLQEKLTLFWHGHFATSANDVKNARHMFAQNDFLRQHCLAGFRDLLRGISRDPAMLKYLDNNTNHKSHPNENYARELMELFTMGIGNYTEDDVKAAARAFTGWTFRGDQFVKLDRQHDHGEKVFLGRRGNFDGDDIIDIILEQPCTARWMAKKFFEFFVYDDPEPAIVEEHAGLLRRHDYQFKPFVRALLKSDIFYSPRAWRTQIKSPAHLVVGSVRYLGAEINARALAVAMRMLGQDLLYPPNVKGWEGGEAWINTNSLLMRYNMAGYLVDGQIPEAGNQPRVQGQQRRMRLSRYGTPKTDFDTLSGPDFSADAPKLVDALVARLLQAPLDGAARAMLIEYTERTRVSQRPATVAHLIMSMPDYQLC